MSVDENQELSARSKSAYKPPKGRLGKVLSGFPEKPWEAAKRISDYAGLITRIVFVGIAFGALGRYYASIQPSEDHLMIFTGRLALTVLGLIWMALIYALLITHMASIRSFMPPPKTQPAFRYQTAACAVLGILTALPVGFVAAVEIGRAIAEWAAS